MSEPMSDLPLPEMVIPFDPPIRRKTGGEVSEIVLQEPTAAQMRTAQSHFRNGNNPQAQTDFALSLVSSVSGVSREVIDQMPISKLLEAAEYLLGFTVMPQRIGSI